VLNDSCAGDIETRKTLSTHTFGSGVAHQQTGIVYSGAAPVSLSSSGALNVLDERVQGVARVVEGPQKALTAAAATSSSTFLAGAADGRVLQYSTAEHSSKILEGEGHASLVAGIAAAAGKAASVAYDDKIKEIDGAGFVCVAAAALHVRMGGSRRGSPAVAPTASQPRGVAFSPDGSAAFVAGVGSIEVFKASQRVHETKPKFAPSSIAATESLVAIGGEVRARPPCLCDSWWLSGTPAGVGQRRAPRVVGRQSSHAHERAGE
jgi:hypothetical protein